MRSIVITGANSGIGYETAKLLIENGCQVFGSVRTAEQGAWLTRVFPRQFVPIIFDVRDEPAVIDAAKQIRRTLQGKTLAGLVNNAGTAIPGPLLHQSLDEFRVQLDTNLVGPFIVTKAFVPLLGADRALSGPPGRVINMSSIGGKLGSPYATAYCASKHGLEGFSEALRRELMPYGISVIIMAPGQVKTPIWEKAASKTVGRFDATPFGRSFSKGASIMIKTARNHGLEPRRVAETIWDAFTAKNPKMRYSPSQHPFLEQGLARLLPRRLMDRVMDRRLGLSQRSATNIDPSSSPSGVTPDRRRTRGAAGE